jgi:hypothetical protein
MNYSMAPIALDAPARIGQDWLMQWRRAIEYEAISEPFSFSTGDGVMGTGQSQPLAQK